MGFQLVGTYSDAIHITKQVRSTSKSDANLHFHSLDTDIERGTHSKTQRDCGPQIVQKTCPHAVQLNTIWDPEVTQHTMSWIITVDFDGLCAGRTCPVQYSQHRMIPMRHMWKQQKDNRLYKRMDPKMHPIPRRLQECQQQRGEATLYWIFIENINPLAYFWLVTPCV